jgi:hypothetical protein
MSTEWEQDAGMHSSVSADNIKDYKDAAVNAATKASQFELDAAVANQQQYVMLKQKLRW